MTLLFDGIRGILCHRAKDDGTAFLCFPPLVTVPSLSVHSYIHGGAWRDPCIDSASFARTQQILLENGTNAITGIVSLNYRLSPYPSHPEHPSSPEDASRNVKHPDHLGDVVRAISFLVSQKLDSTTGKGQQITLPEMNIERYILCGHSCGATLAMQFVHMVASAGTSRKLPLPMTVVGVEGIYDIPDLVLKYTHPAYREFITGAFGSDEELWRQASPVYQNIGDCGWRGNVLLAHSSNDELVGTEQLEGMLESLEQQGWKKPEGQASMEKDRGQNITTMKLSGMHDQVWSEGQELAEVIGMGVCM